VITDAFPARGSDISAASPTFRITITDPNVTDDLYVWWIVDYPPYSMTDTRPYGSPLPVMHSMDGTALSVDKTFTPNCAAENLSARMTHLIFVVVADRPFQTPVGAMPDLTLLTDPAGLKDEASWFWEHQCP
jgi:hypothetical protein